MTGDGCRAELYSDEHHDALKAACAEDREIWQIYANNFGPDGFDAEHRLLHVQPAQPHLRAV